MDSRFFIEAFGYLGSALVVVSMLMSSVVRLRVINTIGSVIFAIYALIIKSYPTALMNLFLICINVYHLMRLRNTEKHYMLVECREPDTYVSYLLQYYKDDIVKFFPGFSGDAMDSLTQARLFTVCCDHEVAGVLVGSMQCKEMDVLLDYSTPVYRDCSVGTYLYDKLPSHGIETLRYSGQCSSEHRQYLEKMGFTESAGKFTKQLRR